MPEADVNLGFMLAALASAATFGVHTFVGGRFAARPLLAAENLPRPTRWLNYMTWHMVTALLVVMSTGFIWAAVAPTAVEAAIVLVTLAGLLSATTVAVTMKAGIQPWRFPSSYLFLIILACGLWGLAAQS